MANLNAVIQSARPWSELILESRGEYTLEAPIRIPEGCQVYGRTSAIRLVGDRWAEWKDGTAIITLAEDAKLQDVGIVGNHDGSPFGKAGQPNKPPMLHGVRMLDRSSLIRCEISNMEGFGVHVVKSGVEVLDCMTLRCGRDGIHATPSMFNLSKRQTTISGCMVFQCGDDGIAINGRAVHGDDVIIELDRHFCSTVIEYCSVFQNYVSRFDHPGRGISVTGARDVHIDRCTIRNTEMSGVCIIDSKECFITSNLIADAGQAKQVSGQHPWGRHGIAVLQRWQDDATVLEGHIIIGNIITNPAGVEFYVGEPKKERDIE